MTCGIVRLICEEPMDPPPGQQGQPLVFDVSTEDVPAELLKLQSNGWQTISTWPL